MILPSEGIGKPSILTAKDARAIIQEAAKKKDFSKEFSRITKASVEVEDVLISVLHSTTHRWEERWFSAVALGKRRSDQAKKALLRASEDELFIVRQAAVQGLSYFADIDTMKAIRGALNDTAMVVRSEAVDAIMKRNDVGSLSLLEKELYATHNFQKGRSMWIRPQIIHAFGKLGDPKALNVLMGALKDKDEKVVNQSCKSLQTLSMKNEWEYPIPTIDCAATWKRWYDHRNQKNTKSAKPEKTSS